MDADPPNDHFDLHHLYRILAWRDHPDRMRTGRKLLAGGTLRSRDEMALGTAGSANRHPASQQVR